METTKVGLREFRDNLSTYVLESEGPIAITRHGDTVGLFIPTRRKRTETELKVFYDAHERLQKEIKAKGLTEDDLMADIDAALKKQKR